MGKILLVDDEQHILASFKAILKGSGIDDVIALGDSREVMPLLEKDKAPVVVMDLTMPYIAGTELLPMIKEEFPDIFVIVMTASNDIETAIECMKAGAFDYLIKPVEKGRFLSSVKRALELSRLREEMSLIKDYLFTDKLDNPSVFSAIITKNKKMRAVFQYIEAIARSRQPVLVTGETGTGKELVAHAIHNASCVRGSFIAVNSAGLDDTMFSDTLFGHKKGAFTGAEQHREGMIAQASDGTLFLDEIGDLSEPSQVKLLRLLQENIYYPLGSDISKKSSARIVVAANRDIRELMKEGRFRKDLYYRLGAHHVHMPPLRERKEDIPLLLDYFLEEAAQSLYKKKPTPPPELAMLLSVYDFPGNVRELQAMVYDAVVQHKSGVLSMESFRKIIKHESPSASQTKFSLFGDDTSSLLAMFGHFPTIKELEDFSIAEALRLSGGNQGIAATMLGITRQTLNRKLKEISSD